VIGLVLGELLCSFVAAPSRSRGAVSDVSMFCIIIWMAYSSVVTVRLSSLLRTIVADATAYFIMAMTIQILVVLFLSFTDVRHASFPVCPHSHNVPTFRIRSANSHLCAYTFVLLAESHKLMGSDSIHAMCVSLELSMQCVDR
jgi:hypothetical protein